MSCLKVGESPSPVLLVLTPRYSRYTARPARASIPPTAHRLLPLTCTSVVTLRGMTTVIPEIFTVVNNSRLKETMKIKNLII